MFAHSTVKFSHELRAFAQERLDVLASLAHLLTLVREPGSGLLHETQLDGDVEDRALATYALSVHDVELGLLERRGAFVLHDLHARAVAHDLGAILDRLDATDVESDRRVELECPSTGRHFWRAVDDADLLA